MLSQSTVDRLRGRFGPEVQPWLDGVPTLVARLSARWGLEVAARMTGGTSVTFRCRRSDGSGAYLKLTPDPDVFATEAAALRAWSSSPAVVSLLDVADEDNALLIEALEPGTPLADWRPAADLLASLRDVPPPTGFPTVADRVDFMYDLARRRNPGVPGELLDGSHAAARRLADTGSVVRLVHGDLHPANVLLGARGYVAIDPRPCLGDPDLDVVDWAFLDVTTVDQLRSRVAGLRVLDEDRAFEWSRALAVLLLMSHVRRGIDDAQTPLFRQLAETLV
ncbi:aminoglycoside phosphotransferase family protein [Kutzneria buriramensis]|uniref:Streptomycin 6-kinase n=1 Tax=Kutzneria buriramensis TaxID=1045776 RepID=A0A3E0HZG7_9PSEU|nr:aminoglycoside phosphotransferase family protein [Kutzneria buriramensis]REH51849.1 streptomycin 6-kinase [Kutzneria buriramensis]